MTVTIRPGKARGTVAAPPSKSFAHRALICAALADGTSVIRGLAMSEDVLATLDCVRSWGSEAIPDGDDVTVRGGAGSPSDRFPCRESGSTLRFFLPLCLLRGTECTLTGSDRLMERPQTVYEELCREQGLLLERSAGSIRVRGPLRAGKFRVRGDVSSQFLTGLLLALPCLAEDSAVGILPPFVSRPYVDLTLDVLARFGIAARQDGLTLRIPGGQRYRSADLTVEGDWSNAAFLDAFNLIGGDVRVTGLCAESRQGDRVYREFYPRLSAGCPTLDVSDCPDLAPVLMALGALRNGVTLTGTARLRDKESDRGAAMANELKKCGIGTEIGEDTLTVRAGKPHAPTVPLDGHNDHRVVMACATLLTAVGGSITGAEAVRKSFPDYFERIRSLGIEVSEE